MRLLVTGGCGYIGSHVVRQLSEAKHEVVVIDDLSKGFREALLFGEKLVVGNFGDETTLEKAFAHGPFDGILHFAAFLCVPESVEYPLKYYQNNSSNTVTLLKAAVHHKVRFFVLSSTGATYGDQKVMPVAETAIPDPQNPYARSKLMDEQILKDVGHAHELKYVILRYFNVAGADSKNRIGQRTPDATHLIKVACEMAVGKRDSVTVTGSDWPTPDGTGVRDYIHVEDLADAHIAALKYLASGGKSDLFNCGYGHGSSVRDVLNAFQRATGKKLKIIEGPRRPGDVAMVIADSTKLRTVMGWKPKFDSIETICKTAFDWEQKNLGR